LRKAWIKEELRTRSIDAGFFYFSWLPSTNSFLKDNCGETNAVCVADQQTAGRGRLNRSWISDGDASLTFSVAWRTGRSDISQLAVLAGVRMVHVLRSRFGIGNAGLIWPNDVLVDGRKLAGILGESVPQASDRIVIIGVGLNVNQKEFHSDAPNPGSLIHFTGKEENVPQLLEEILDRLKYYYEKLKTDIHILKDSYLQQLYRINIWADYEDTTGKFIAKITGVDQYGRLLLMDRQGHLRTYGFKEVNFLH